MKKLSSKTINSLLKEFEQKYTKGKSKEDLTTKIKNSIVDHFENKAILGFDIYRYSQYPLLEQSLIPHLFKTLYNDTINHCIEFESYIFQSKKINDFKDYFIDGGDGGFQIFDTPFHAVVFAMYFQANIKRYNSGKDPYYFGLRKIVGEITLRYAITYDSTFTYEKNFYGPSIINNARIMAKDKLNRMLIDENTFCWFTEIFNGIENLHAITFEHLTEMEIFKGYKKSKEESAPSVIFSGRGCKILSVHILKIGEIRSKLDILSIHSLHTQTLMFSKGTPGLDMFTITLGNLNSSGITD